MRWQPSLVARLGRVRDLRMRLAEMEIVRADRALEDSRQAERDAQQALQRAVLQRQADVAEADRALVSNRAGGRIGISNWHDARRRAEGALQKAHVGADDAVAERLDKELACSSARQEWRGKRLDVERLRMLVENRPDTDTRNDHEP